MAHIKFGTETAISEEVAERLSRFTERDQEFSAAMKKWERPQGAPRYNLDVMKTLVRYHEADPQVIDVERFLQALHPRDRIAAAEIATWVSAPYINMWGTDKTLNMFRLEFMRRLDACGF